jgi:pimeloyl-ACP methyl ester carboxylesterase
MRAFDPLLAGLPAEMREAARAAVRGYDAASVAATTAFMASGAQPFARAEELAEIGCPTLVVPGVDPTHPREIADVFAKGIAGAEVVETVDYAGAISGFVVQCEN